MHQLPYAHAYLHGQRRATRPQLPRAAPRPERGVRHTERLHRLPHRPKRRLGRQGRGALVRSGTPATLRGPPAARLASRPLGGGPPAGPAGRHRHPAHRAGHGLEVPVRPPRGTQPGGPARRPATPRCPGAPRGPGRPGELPPGTLDHRGREAAGRPRACGTHPGRQRAKCRSRSRPGAGPRARLPHRLRRAAEVPALPGRPEHRGADAGRPLHPRGRAGPSGTPLPPHPEDGPAGQLRPAATGAAVQRAGPEHRGPGRAR